MPVKTVTIITLCAILILAPCLSSGEEAEDEADRLLRLATGLYVRGPVYHRQAIIQYREFLNRYPNDKRCDEATFFLGKCLRKQGSYEEALRVFLNHQKFKGSPRRDEANLRTGQIYFSLGKYAEAVQYLLKVYNKKQVDENLVKSSALWLGRAYLESNQPEKAIPPLVTLADGKKNPWAPYANFYLGRAYRDRGDLSKAIERFQKAEATLPEKNAKAEALFMMAEAYANMKKYGSAYAAYKTLVEKHAESPFHGRAAFGAVWSLHKAGSYGDTIKAYEVCQKFIPQDSQAEATYILGNSYYNTKKLDEALEAYRRVSRNDPKSVFAPRADYEACFCLFLQNKFDEMVASGKSFVKNYASRPEVGNIHFLMAESLYERNQIDEARFHYQAVVVKYPKSLFFEQASFKLGDCQLKQGRLEEARKTFRDFAAAYPTSELAVTALARAAEECGLELVRKAKPKPQLQRAQYREVARDYEALYKALVKKDAKAPLAGETLYKLGVTYLKLDKYDEMAKAFKGLVKSYPKNNNCAEAYYWLASESEKAKEYDNAIDFFERSVNLKSKGAYAQRAKRRLADVYFKKDDKEKAAGLIVEILRSDPQSDVAAETHLWAGEFLLEKENYDRAIEMYALFLKKFRGNPLLERAYYGLGDCYFKQGKWQKAIDNFTRAIELKGDWISLSRLQSGIAHVKLGQNKQAEQLLLEVKESGRPELEAKAIFWLGNMDFELARAMKSPKDKAAQYNKALRKYITVVIVHNNSEVRPECMYRAAECLEQGGLLSKDEKLLQESKEQLRELIRDYPDNEFAKKALKKLGTEPPPQPGE